VLSSDREQDKELLRQKESRQTREAITYLRTALGRPPLAAPPVTAAAPAPATAAAAASAAAVAPAPRGGRSKRRGKAEGKSAPVRSSSRLKGKRSGGPPS
jgi:hypothetical protein